MTALAGLALAGLVRAPGRTAVRTIALAAAVALLGAMLLVVGHSLGTMSTSAVRSIPLDWQAPVGSHQAAVRAATAVGRQMNRRVELVVSGDILGNPITTTRTTIGTTTVVTRP